MRSTTRANGHTPRSDPEYHQVHQVHIPDAVRDSGCITPELIAEAVAYLHKDGVIVLDNAVDRSHLDRIEALLISEAEEIAKDPDHHYNFGKETRNIDQAPPLIPDLMYQDVWANSLACAILKVILGPDLMCHYANGNTALPRATAQQPVHSDIEKPHPIFPFAYIVNIPLCDVSPSNGSTEFWLGTHQDSCIDQHTGVGELTIKPSLVEARRQLSPPVYPTTQKGSLIIRDIRLWHAGVPNRSDRSRIVLAYVFQPKWFQAPSKVVLPRKAKKLVDKWQQETGLEYSAEWVDGDVDHKKIKSTSVDFSSTNRKILEMEHLMHLPVH